jgi:hypothetical protein
MLDCDGNVFGPNDLELGSFENIGPLVITLVSTLNVPSNCGFESIATLTILDLEIEVAWELLKIQLTLQQKA